MHVVHSSTYRIAVHVGGVKLNKAFPIVFFFFLFAQCRDGILDGTHPCTQEEASQVCVYNMKVFTR